MTSRQTRTLKSAHKPALIPGLVLAAALLAPAALMTGCAGTTMKVKESLGIAKREQLVSEVKDARNAQQQAKDQFSSTMAEFKAITGFNGGALERQYEKVRYEAERSADRAGVVRDNISSVERIANAMFREWDQELAQYTSETLRSASAEQLSLTRERYRQMMAAMNAAQARMRPVLQAFDDQVLFLKHNLNARAIASLQTTVNDLQLEIDQLIADMNASIDQANAFILRMQTDPGAE